MLRSALVVAALILSAASLAAPALAQAGLAQPPEDAGGGPEEVEAGGAAAQPGAAGVNAPPARSPFEAAQRTTAERSMDSYRERLVVVYGAEACPKPTRSDEVIVCARRPAEDQFRIPPNLRNEPAPEEAESAARRSAMVEATGKASGCDASGPNPGPGCVTRGWAQGPRLRDTARLLLEGAEVTRIMPDGTEVPY